MAVYLVNVEPGDVESMTMLIKGGRYTSVEQFLAIAIRNQLTYEQHEEQRTSAGLVVPKKTNTASASGNNAGILHFARKDTLAMVEGVEKVPTSQLLWGQYYRFLPLKAALRLIINEFHGGPFLLYDARKIVQDRIMVLADLLESKKIAGRCPIRLDVGFPSRSRDLRKSIDRFILQYVGKCNTNGDLTGFPGDMGFLAKAEAPDDCALRLTSPGATFAQLANPLLDSSSVFEPLNFEEKRFLVDYVCNLMPAEASHMAEVVRAIESGKDTPSALLEEMRGFYQTAYANKKLSEAQITLMRSGCTSRLVELGIVTASRSNGRVGYSISRDHPELARRVLAFQRRSSGNGNRRKHGTK